MPTLPCIVCGRGLESAVPGAPNQPYAGTAFFTHGHYGSTVFDPLDKSYLEVNICDECLVHAAHKGRVVWGPDRKSKTERKWEPGWNGTK